MSTNLPISSLDPLGPPTAGRTIKGVVTLLWPYSSSTRQCAFLLSDPDFRLRSKRGQVRVRFTGASAQAVAEAHVGIGDHVELGLWGGKWEAEDEGVRSRTPGRGVEGELVFGRRVGLGVWRGGEETTGEVQRVEVDAPVSPPATAAVGVEGQLNGHTTAFTPAPAPARPQATNDLLRRSLDGSFINGNGGGADWTYASPAFAKRVRLSSGEDSRTFQDFAAFDPFVDDDGGQARRTSFGPGLRWRLKSRTPSPVKEGFADWEEGREGELEVDVESPSRGGRFDDVVGDGTTTAEKEDVLEIESPTRPSRPQQPTTMSTEPPAITAAKASEPRVSSTSPSAMPPPSLPRLSIPEGRKNFGQTENPQQPGTEGPSKPKLQPVKSPTLPLPSPFPADAPSSLSAALATAPRPYAANSLFGDLGNASSVIERRRTSGKLSQSRSQTPQRASLPPPRHSIAPTPPTATIVKTPQMDQPAVPPAATETVDLTDEQDEDADMHDTIPSQDANVNQSFSTTIADDDMYDDYERSLTATLATEKIIVRDHDAGVWKETRDSEAAPNAIEAGKELHDHPLESDNESVDAQERLRDYGLPVEEHRSLGESSELPPKLRPDEFSLDGAVSAVPPPRPSPQKRKLSPAPKEAQIAGPTTPAPATPAKEQLPGTLALDGASSPISARVTPQSEKERVRKSTYRSLFGLRSPQREQAGTVTPQAERQEERFIPGWFFEIEGQQQPDVELEDDNAGKQDVSTDTVSTEAQPEEVIVADGVVMLDEDDAFDQAKLQRLEPDEDLQRTPTVSEPTAPTQRMQVIELDASSDVGEEEEEARDAETRKAAQSDVPYSLPVIQDSLEDLQADVFVMPENEQASRRRGMRTAAQKLKGEKQVATSPSSSSSPEKRFGELAKERADVEDSLAQQHQLSSVAQDVDAVSSPTPKASNLPTFEQDVEEHIAPPRSTAGTTVRSLDHSSESEDFSSSPILRTQRVRDSQEQPRPSTQGPSYPALPLSPSKSQPLRDMQLPPVIEEPVRSRLPPTPQLTQRESSTRTEERASQKTPASRILRNESSLHAEAKATESPITPQTKTPSRRSARLRTSNVPDVLSEWFSPRSSSVAANKKSQTVQDEIEHTAALKETVGAAALTKDGHTTASKAEVAQLHTTGFATAHSYFTPLSKLPELMNPSSQHAHGTGALDFLAVVTDQTKKPVCAKTGPRDYFTIFRIADPSLPSNDNIRVEVFRPYKNTLPTAEVGDVVLLRAFVVKSRKRTPYLLSTDASAWCVWRYPDALEAEKPVWARKGKANGVEEDIKGPPVEFGNEERGHAGRLREWWVDGQVGDDGEQGGDAMKGKIVKEVISKL